MATGFVVFSAIVWIIWMAIKDAGLLSLFSKKKQTPLEPGVVLVDRAGAFQRLDELIAFFNGMGIDSRDLRAAGRKLYDDVPVKK